MLESSFGGEPCCDDARTRFSQFDFFGAPFGVFGFSDIQRRAM
jgi:hypothetical protein